MIVLQQQNRAVSHRTPDFVAGKMMIDSMAIIAHLCSGINTAMLSRDKQFLGSGIACIFPTKEIYAIGILAQV